MKSDQTILEEAKGKVAEMQRDINDLTGIIKRKDNLLEMAYDKVRILDGKVEQLKAELSQAKEEKAKAFDDGAEAAQKYLDEFGCINLTDLVNPYTPKDLTLKK